MVLDDLGLVPTLRRSAAIAVSGAGIGIDFGSFGHRTTPAQPNSRGACSGIVETPYWLPGVARRVASPGLGTTRCSVDGPSADLHGRRIRNHGRDRRCRRDAGDDAAARPGEMIRRSNRPDERDGRRAHPWRRPPCELAERAGALGVGLTVLDDGMTVEVVARPRG